MSSAEQLLHLCRGPLLVLSFLRPAVLLVVRAGRASHLQPVVKPHGGGIGPSCNTATRTCSPLPAPKPMSRRVSQMLEGASTAPTPRRRRTPRRANAPAQARLTEPLPPQPTTAEGSAERPDHKWHHGESEPACSQARTRSLGSIGGTLQAGDSASASGAPAGHPGRGGHGRGRRHPGR